MLSSGSPFSNPSRPNVQPPKFNSATHHPASVFPPSSQYLQTRPHVTSARHPVDGNTNCSSEQGWVQQWTEMRRDWHPASLGTGGTSNPAGVTRVDVRVKGDDERAKL